MPQSSWKWQKQRVMQIFVSVHYPSIFFLPLAEPASTKENNCLNAAKACNLNDTCKKYRSAYISPCTSRVSASEICNKRKCHKALRHFFDKVISTEGLFSLVVFLVFPRYFCLVQGFRVWHNLKTNLIYMNIHECRHLALCQSLTFLSSLRLVHPQTQGTVLPPYGFPLFLLFYHAQVFPIIRETLTC